MIFRRTQHRLRWTQIAEDWRRSRRASHLKINSPRFLFVFRFISFFFFSSVKMWLQASGDCESRPKSEENIFWKQLKFLAVAKKNEWSESCDDGMERLIGSGIACVGSLRRSSCGQGHPPRISIVYRRIKKSRFGMGSVGFVTSEERVTR